MNVECFINNSVRRRVNKNLVSTGTMNDISFVSDFDEENPIILFSEPLPANTDYLKIKGKYYFIDNVVHVNDSLYRAECQLDYLYTYRTVIQQTEAYIDRSETVFNNYVDDQDIVLEEKTVTSIIDFEKGFEDQRNDGVYVLVTGQSEYSQPLS